MQFGVAAPFRRPERIIADRYLIIEVLATSRAKRVLACFDLEQRTSVVLKEASLDNEFGLSGLEARDLLVTEHENLRLFSDTGKFPVPQRCFDTEEFRYLVMEYIEGQTLDQRISSEKIHIGNLPFSEIERIFCSICETLKYIHQRGYVHGDVKSSNIVISSDDIVFVDLEFCRRIGTILLPGVGTRGYLSEERQAGRPVTEKDDIYAIGCILYLLCTGAEPSLAPAEKSLMSRSLDVLRPDLPPAAFDTILGALNGAYSSVQDMLNSFSNPAGDLRVNRMEPSRMQGARKPAAPDDALQLALDLGKSIVNSAVISDKRVHWATSDRSAGGMDLKDINTGSAGTLLALCCLQELHPDGSRELLIRECAYSLMRPFPEPMQIPGLYVGLCGTSLACSVQG